MIGFTTHKTPTQSRPGNCKDFHFRHEIEEAAELVPHCRKQSDILIALTHIGHGRVGLGGDLELARRVQGLDMIIGGHSEQALFKPVRENGCLVFQAKNWGRYVGRADFTYIDGKLSLDAYKLIPVNLKSEPDHQHYHEDPHVHDFLKPYYEKEKHLLHKTLTVFRKNYDKQALMKLIAASMTAAIDSPYPKISLMNSGGCRLPGLSAGPVLYRDVLMLLPFNNRLCSIEVSGKQLMPLLKKGMRVGRLGGITLKQGRFYINNSPINTSGKYTFICSDFIAEGGDGFPVLTDYPAFRKHGSDSEAMKQFLEKFPGKAGNPLENKAFTNQP